MLDLDRPARKVKWGIVLSLLAAYILAFVWLRASVGPLVAMLAVLPIISAAWFFGVWRGLAFTLLILSIEIGLSFLLGFSLRETVLQQGGALTLLVSVLIVLVVGRLGELTRERIRQVVEREQELTRSDAHLHFMTSLNGILRAALQAEDMPTLLRVLEAALGELFSAEACFLTLWDEDRQTTIPAAVYGPAGRAAPVGSDRPDPRSLTAAVLEAGHTLTIDEITSAAWLDPQEAALFSRLRSALALPLIASGQKLGALILGFAQSHPFSPEEIEDGELAARQISLAISRVLLLEGASNRVRELSGLQQISQAFSLHEDDRQTYGLLSGILAGLLGIKKCILSLYDPATQELRAQTPAYGLSDEVASAFHHPAELAVRAWNFPEAGAFRANTREEIPSEFLPLIQPLEIDCLLAAPLRDADRHWVGTLYAMDKPGGFNPDDVHLIETFASQAAVVIQNTHLLSLERKRSRELAVLQEVAAAATEGDDEADLIQRVTLLIGERLYPVHFGILLLDPVTRELSLSSIYPSQTRQESLRLGLGVEVTGSVARSGKARRVDDLARTPEPLSLLSEARSALCVPLKVGEEIIGVANAESTSVSAFSQQDEELLTILAGQIASAIQRLRTAKAEHYQANQLSRSNALIRALAQLGARAAAVTDPEGVMQTLGSELGTLGLRCLIALSDPETKQATIRYTSLPKHHVTAIERILGRKIQDYAIPVERLSPDPDSVPGSSIIRDPVALVQDLNPGFSRQATQKFLRTIGVIETTSVCQLPLVSEGKLIGSLWMWGEGLHEGDLPTLSLFASQVATAIQNARLLDEVQRLAITDELTGIFNRRHFFNLAEVEFSRAKRYSHPLSALIADIDHFKQFNDRYGHWIGDQVLQGVAQLLLSSLRESDVLGRYGGEEFSVLLPVTDLQAARLVAERLLSRIAAAPIPTEAGELPVQLSVGVAGLSKATPTLLALINRADQAMYLAKEAGRNRVAVK